MVYFWLHVVLLWNGLITGNTINPYLSNALWGAVDAFLKWQCTVSLKGISPTFIWAAILNFRYSSNVRVRFTTLHWRLLANCLNSGTSSVAIDGIVECFQQCCLKITTKSEHKVISANLASREQIVAWYEICDKLLHSLCLPSRGPPIPILHDIKSQQRDPDFEHQNSRHQNTV